MDGVVFAYLVALCVGSALVCGLVPAWQASRPNLAATLNDAGRASAGSRWRRRWTGAFVVAQVAGALVLLTGATLMMKNLASLMRTDVGVETSGLSQMAFILRQNDDTPERRRLLLGQLEERLASSTGVNAAIASDAPLGGASVPAVRVEGRPAASSRDPPGRIADWRRSALFRRGRRAMIAGRRLTPDDVRQPDDGVVVNERFAGCISRMARSSVSAFF